LPNNEFHANYNGLCSEKALFTTSGWQIQQIDKRSTQQHHHANEGKSGFEAERVQAVGPLRSLRSKKKLAADK